MMAIYGPLQLILSVVYFMMIIHIIMSWLINFRFLIFISLWWRKFGLV